VLPRRSGFPVTDVPDRTASTVFGTAPVRCVGFASCEPEVPFRADGPAVGGDGLAEAAAGLAAPAPAPAIAMATTDAAIRLLRCIHHVALISFLPNQDE